MNKTGDFSNSVYVKGRESDEKWAVFRTEDDTEAVKGTWWAAKLDAEVFASQIKGVLTYNYRHPNDNINISEYRMQIIDKMQVLRRRR